MRIIDLFSGIGGFSLAASWVWPGQKTVGFVERDEFCQKTIRKNFGDDAPIYGDIRDFNGKTYRGTVDILTGGFPCQPFSVSGKQRGKEDDCYLWPEMLRVISEVRPAWIIAENVTGIVNMALEQVCVDMESQGYEVQPFIIPACAVNAPHRRDRVWIVAHRSDSGVESLRREREDTVFQNADASEYALRKNRESNWSENWPEVAAHLCRVDDGLSRRVDRVNRLKALGNAIVPQVAVIIMQGIKDVLP